MKWRCVLTLIIFLNYLKLLFWLIFMINIYKNFKKLLYFYPFFFILKKMAKCLLWPLWPKVRACMRFFRKRGKKGQNIWKFEQKFKKFENILKKGRWWYAIIAQNTPLEKALLFLSYISILWDSCKANQKNCSFYPFLKKFCVNFLSFFFCF